MTETSLNRTLPPIGRARAALLRRLIDTVAMPASRLSPQDRHMASDILLDMLFEAGDEERLLCAKRLKLTVEAPRRLMRYLAHCKIDIAGQLLEENLTYDAADLSDIVRSTGLEHQMMIAARRDVSVTVSEALIDAGSVAALRILLGNSKAQISESGIDKLVALSQQHDDLCILLVARPELTPSQAMSMFWWADGPTRKSILMKQSADRMILVDLCSDVFVMMQEEGWQDPIARKAMQLIERRQRNRAALERSEFQSLEQALTFAAKTGITPTIMQEIGYLAGVRPVCIVKLMTDLGGEGLAVLCKATGLKRPALKYLWKAMGRPVHLDAKTLHPQLNYVFDIFDTLSVTKAQTVLRYWNWSLTAAGPPKASAANDSDKSDEFSASKRTAKLVFGS